MYILLYTFLLEILTGMSKRLTKFYEVLTKALESL